MYVIKKIGKGSRMMRLSIYIISMFFLLTVCCIASGQPRVKGTGQSEHVQQDDHNHSQDNFSIAKLIKPAGVLTILSLFSTLTLGLIMKKNRKVIFPWHRRCAFLTGACAIIHSTLVMLH
jgi:hypothetical protein